MDSTMAPVNAARIRLSVAIGTAIVLLVAARLGYGMLKDRYARAFRSVPIAEGSLSGLPLVIGEWQGRDEPMTESLIRVTDTDDRVNRRYRSTLNRREIGLWIGYGGRLRDLVPHRPEICYPANGYSLEERRHVDLEAPDGTPVPCTILRFSRGDTPPERLLVLDYYLVDGEYSPDVSLLREKAMRLQHGRHYVAQIQIVSAYDPLSKTPESAVRSFARDSAVPIRTAVQSAVEAALSASGSEVQP